MSDLTITHKELVPFLKSVGTKRTVMVLGENGVGKTSVQYMLMNDPEMADYIITPPIDCTQLSDGSVFVPDLHREKGTSTELPNDRFGVSSLNHRGIKGAQPVVLCFDEFAKAPRYVRNMLAPVIGPEARLGPYYLPDRSIRWCTSNLAAEGLGDLLEAHQRNRMIIVQLAKPTHEQWEQWALGEGLNAIVLATVRDIPKVFDSFLDYMPGARYANRKQAEDNPYIFNPKEVQAAYASPRSLHTASDIFNEHENTPLTDNMLHASLAGAVGRAFAGELMVRYRLNLDMPSMADIFNNPTGTRVPDNPAVHLLVLMKLLNPSIVKTRKQADAGVDYLLRLREEFQMLMVDMLIDTIDTSTGKLEIATLYVSNKKVQEMIRSHRKFR